MCVAPTVDATFMKTVSRSCSRYRGAGFSGKAFRMLLGRPCSRGMVGDGDVHDRSPVVREYDEHEQ